MKNIGVFSGTFDPIHNGHLALCSHAVQQLSLDMLLLLPTFSPIHKASAVAATFSDRLTMCNLATATSPIIQVKDWDQQFSKRGYFYETCLELKKLFPSFYTILGPDTFMSLGYWYQHAAILENTIIFTAHDASDAQVPEKAIEYQKKGGTILCWQADLPPISSTAIRDNIAQSRAFLPEEVWTYLQNNGLYS